MALLALPVTVGASITLLLSLRARRDGGDLPGRAADRGAAALAVLSVACPVAFLVLDPYATSDVPRQAALGLGIAAFAAPSAAFAATSRSRV